MSKLKINLEYFTKANISDYFGILSINNSVAVYKYYKEGFDFHFKEHVFKDGHSEWFFGSNGFYSYEDTLYSGDWLSSSPESAFEKYLSRLQTLIKRARESIGSLQDGMKEFVLDE